MKEALVRCKTYWPNPAIVQIFTRAIGDFWYYLVIIIVDKSTLSVLTPAFAILPFSFTVFARPTGPPYANSSPAKPMDWNQMMKKICESS